jgi:AcrR family transcriptional regulator
VTQRGRQAEAARNDLRLLTAAREVFSAQGFDAPVSAVAERAGVGIGSLYRRYGTKEELLQHLCVVAMQQAADAAQEAFRQPDPWDGLVQYICACVEFGSGGLAPIAGHIQTTPEMWETHKAARQSADRLVRRARSAGLLRPGATALDIALLIEQFSRQSAGPRDEEQDNARRRLLAIAIDGLHARNCEPLPGRAPSQRTYEGRWRAPAPNRP